MAPAAGLKSKRGGTPSSRRLARRRPAAAEVQVRYSSPRGTALLKRKAVRPRMKAIAIFVVALVFAPWLNAGIMERWETQILEVEIVSCVQPSLSNVHLLARIEQATDEQALAALPAGAVLRARLIRSRVVEESVVDELGKAPEVHSWQRAASPIPVVYFFPVWVPADKTAPKIQAVCGTFPPRKTVQLWTTTATDCDTPGRMDLCLFAPLQIVRELGVAERKYASGR
jgi:hypothetical protein